MWSDILIQAWIALRRNPTRSLLTLLGIVWGIAAVTLLLAYGDGFQNVMVGLFENFSKTAVIAFPGQTSLQIGGERAGRRIQFDPEDIAAAKAESPAIRRICTEIVRRVPVSYETQSFDIQVRGVCADYGEIRSEVPIEGRWFTPEDEQERRHVAFLGDWAKNKLFSGRPAIGEEITIAGIRFTVIGRMDQKMSFGNYYGPDDRAVFIPYATFAELARIRYPGNLVIEPISGRFEDQADRQFREAIARRKGFDPKDKRAIETFGTSDMRPIVDGLTIGLRGLLLFIGFLTLAIGGIGLMNIMLVAVSERTREIGLRRALGATRRAIAGQFLAEAVALTLLGGLLGAALSYAFVALMPPLPLLGEIFDDRTGKTDLHLVIRLQSTVISAAVLCVVGVVSGLIPALRAAYLDPVEALRVE
ncbi:MAG: ABC transporter permease [Bryobacteraceae bacterium]